MALDRWLHACLLGAFTLGSGPTGCREESTPQLEQFTPPDIGLGPRELRTDRASGAMLAKPHGAWSFADGAQLRGWDEAAVLGAKDDAGRCWGWVSVGTPGDGDPRSFSQGRLAATRSPQARVDVNEYVLFADHTAHRWELEEPASETSQGAHAVRVTTLVEGPWRYTVWAHARGGDYRRRRHCLDEFTSGFDLALPEAPTK